MGRLESNHERYEELLRDHFMNLLKRYPGKLPVEPIPEVALVHDYNGGILKFLEKGKLQKELSISQARLAALDTDEKTLGKRTKLENQIKAVEHRIEGIDKSLNHQSSLRDVDREVRRAFVIF